MVMTDVLLRAAKSSDIPEITGIYAHAVRQGTASFELDPPDTVEMSRRHRALVERGYPYIVGQSAGELLGYAYAGPFRTRPAYRWTIEDSIYVAPHAHRRGVGSALLRRRIEMCEAKGFRQMVAVIGDSANTSSIELHRTLGFHMVGTLAYTGFKFGRWIDTVLMQRSLGSGAASVPGELSSPPPPAGRR
jgi:phosphinothricin acetyltransferase